MWRQGVVGTLCIWGVFTSGCGGQDAARISEVSTIQARVASDASVRAESQNRDQRARDMERELAERQNFYNALNGEYLGQIHTQAGPLAMRVRWVSMLPALPRTSRVRSLDELIYDLNFQALSVQIFQAWSVGSPDGGDCTVESVRPDLVRGVISVVSSDCDAAYIFRIAETAEQSREYARRILSGDGGPVPELFGESLPGGMLRKHAFRLVRQ